jgi:hypothetical protein
MSVHTPGPWQAKHENQYVPTQVWSDGRQLAEVYGESRDSRKANAALMAAAPELLAALTNAKNALECSKDQSQLNIAAVKGALAAIAKAEGL